MSHDCPHLDETLSTFLDGMPKTSSQPDLHHQECPRCLDALRRSRRLDALDALEPQLK